MTSIRNTERLCYAKMVFLRHSCDKYLKGLIREIMMGVGNRVASVIMLTFPSEPCPHADFSK